MSNLKVEGKVSDFCPYCKNCKSVTREYDGNEVIRITEVECEDPYDGMVKTLDADSDICCSMFEPKTNRACEKCERFDGVYCHGPNGTVTISYKALFGESVNCPSYSEKKARESEESRIEELIKASKRKDELIQDYREKLKKADELADSWKREYEKKYRDEISKLQNIVTEKEVEIKSLRKDNVYLKQNEIFADARAATIAELKQTIEDQDMTIKALLITIKEMCKDE